MQRIRIGQIGVCHAHAAAKIATLRGMPEVFEIVGVVDDRASSGAKFAGDDLTPYEGLPFLREEELLDSPGLQAVLVETSNAFLVPTALRCMERNLAIHMDKPGGETLEPYARLRRGCEARRLPFQIGYMFRGNPALGWCVKAVRKGWLGEILEIQGSMSHNYGGAAYQDYLGRFAGGILYTLGCHLIDLVVGMLGRPDNVISFLKSVPGFPDTTRNHCLTILDYPHATATLRACSPDAGGIDRRRFRVSGTRGVAELCPLERFDGEPLRMRLTLLEGNEDHPAGTHVADFGVNRNRYREQLLELAGMIDGERENPYPCEHDLLVQEVLLAASGYTAWAGAR
jgi:predicted dehydrogenase